MQPSKAESCKWTLEVMVLDPKRCSEGWEDCAPPGGRAGEGCWWPLGQHGWGGRGLQHASRAFAPLGPPRYASAAGHSLSNTGRPRRCTLQPSSQPCRLRATARPAQGGLAGTKSFEEECPSWGGSGVPLFGLASVVCTDPQNSSSSPQAADLARKTDEPALCLRECRQPPWYLLQLCLGAAIQATRILSRSADTQGAGAAIAHLLCHTFRSLQRVESQREHNAHLCTEPGLELIL